MNAKSQGNTNHGTQNHGVNANFPGKYEPCSPVIEIKLTIQGNIGDDPAPWKSCSQKFGVNANLPG